MAELLLELMSEEIPARMQARAAEDLKRLVTERLKKSGLEFADARAYVTPRRLALVIEGLPEKQPDITEEKKGPKVGAPEQAIQGFLKANGLGSIDEAELRETEKGRFYFAVRHVAGQATAEVLPPLLEQAVKALSWPKSMRWAGGQFRWVRPLHSILSVFSGQAFRGVFDVGQGVEIGVGGHTRGHRFLSPDPFEVSSFAEYEAKLREAYVILHPAERKTIIAERTAALAAAEDLAVMEDPALLDEVTGLVEWPVVLMGRVDAAYMDLPPEVLTTAMRHHQKYFSTLDQSGKLADRFILVANMESADGGKVIVAGNERVLRARLADARFFWDQDRKRTLASHAPALEKIVFHAKLGTLDEKIDRMQALAVEVARFVPGANRDQVRSAARLAKADLVTGMVGEFPELQGVMGRYYALNDGESWEVADAVGEHYAPQGPSDRCPKAPVSVAVALADKLDTLVGMFAIGETPTGSKDPYALRRAALGVIRLIVENKLRVPLTGLFEQATALYLQGVLKSGGAAAFDRERVARDLLDFFAERLKVALRDKGVRHDLVSAVFALGGEDDLVRLLDRVKALETFLGSDDGANLLVAYRRAANIVRIESKKEKAAYEGDVETERFCQDEERTLFEALHGALAESGQALADENFTGAMAAMARLRQPVDAFFDHVTVNAEDTTLRANRLNLLSRIGATLGQVADFSKIEG
ncbi:MAG: glycine--tRNA ligase subunit beta [Rhodospirillales bacterium]|nr:glycine--tRNA ligase subunit beta [Rhodospirillales bacterium]